MAEVSRKLPDIIKTDAQINTSDVVSYFVAEYERKLKEGRKELQSRLSRARKRLSASKEKRTKIVSELADRRRLEIHKTCAEFIEKVQGTPREIQSISGTRVVDNKEVEISVTVRDKDRSIFHCAAPIKTVALPAEYAEHVRTEERLVKDIDNTEAKLLEVRQYLQDLGSVERSMRGELGYQALSESEEGQILADQLSSRLQQQLPSFLDSDGKLSLEYDPED